MTIRDLILAQRLARTTPALLAFLFVYYSSNAQNLQFEQTSITLQAIGTERELIAVFPVQNRGSSHVLVQEVNSLCGCIDYSSKSRDIAPGEMASIALVYRVGPREGIQHFKIDVVTNEATNNRYELSLEVNIPQLIHIEPRFLIWRSDESKSEKTVEIQAAPGHVVRLVRVDVAEDGSPFSWRIGDDDSDDLQKVIVSPNDDAADVQRVLMLTFELDRSTETKRAVLLRVLPPIKLEQQ